MYSDKELLEKLDRFREMPAETEWLEFKEAKNGIDLDKVGKYFSGLGNEANLKKKNSAWLILGVKDKPPRHIVDTKFRSSVHERNSLKREIVQHTNGIGLQEIYELLLPEGRVVMLQIPAAPAGIPISWKGHEFCRAGESLVALSTDKRDTIRAQNGHTDWSAGICPEANIRHLEEQALAVARSKFLKKYQTRLGKEVGDWDDITFLEKAKLTRNGQITRTAILLLGKSEASHFLNPNPAQITWKLDTDEEAYEHFGPPFLLSIEQVFKAIRNINFRFQPANQLVPIELTKYEPKVILEALNNCIAHQDYFQNARIIVKEKTDFLLFENAGKFYEGNVEDYVLREHIPRRYRNPFLVEAMVNLDMIDSLGMGIRRMFKEQRKRYFPLPDYDLSEEGQVKLTIFGKLIDENYSQLLIEQADLSLSEVLALDSIQKKRKVSKQVITELKKKNLLEGRYPNIFISSRIAEVTDSMPQYIKNRGFDDAYYEKMIHELLERKGEASRSDINELIFSKLPEVLDNKQKINKIGNLLSKMRRKGEIENLGSLKKPRWVKTGSL